MLLPFVLNFLYSLTFILGKYVLHSMKPIFFTGIRMFGSGVLSFIAYAFFDFSWKNIRSLSKKDWVLIVFLAITNIYITNAFEFWGLQYLPAGKSAFIYNLTPFFAALISYFIFHELMTMKKWIGLGIGFLGVLPLLTGQADVTDTTMRFWFLSLAELSLLCAAIATAFGWISMRVFVKKSSISPYFLNGASMILGSFFCFAHSYALEEAPFVQYDNFAMMSFIIFVMMLSLMLAYNLASHLLKKYTATFLFFFGFTCPMITAALGALFLNEPISVRFVLSAVGVFVGLYLFYQEELKQGYVVK